jgi:ribonuclease Z
MDNHIKRYLKYKNKMIGYGPKAILKERERQQNYFIFKDLTFLGTNSGMPTKYRNVSSSCLTFLGGETWMFDCGEATQHQLLKCQNVSAGNIEKIFITHLHGDHLYGLPGLMCSLSTMRSSSGDDEEEHAECAFADGFPDFSKNSKYLEIYGPMNLAKYIRGVFENSQVCLKFKYRVNELIPPSDIRKASEERIKLYWCEERPNYIYPNPDGTYNIINGEITVNAGILQHPIFSVGYVITEPTISGTMNMDKVTALGVPKGPLLRQLKSGMSVTFTVQNVDPENHGEQTITVHPNQVLDPPIIGRKMVILGDTADSRMIAPMVIDADFLVHESTLSNMPERFARQRGHSTAYMAGKFAGSVNAKNLILTHFGSKYLTREKDQKEIKDMDELIREASVGYREVNPNPANIVTAEDFFVFPLSRK